MSAMQDATRTDRSKLEERIAALRVAERRRRSLGQMPLRTRDARGRASSLVDVDLTPAQRAIVELPRGVNALVLGEAGHGKTTVALHRLAALMRRGHASSSVAFIVPTEGLAILLRPLLRRLGVDVDVTTYDVFARRQARHAFRDIPRRESEDPPASVVAWKRHPALRAALEVLAKRPVGTIDDESETRARSSRANARRADLQHLFGDRVLLESVLPHAPELTARSVEDVLAHDRVQFSRPAEIEHANVIDQARLVAVDGRKLDEGTTNANARSIDVEDYAILFELDRLRAATSGKPSVTPKPYDVIVVDEAQELAPFELRLIGRSLAPGGTAVIAGDAAQQIDPSVVFDSWESAMNDLGIAQYEEVTLDAGHRCPPGVVALARSVVGRDATGSIESVSASAEGAPLFTTFDDELALAAWLVVELDRITSADPRASVGVIARSWVAARRLTTLMQPFVRCRWSDRRSVQARAACRSRRWTT